MTPSLTIARASGSSLFDAAGVEYVDLSMGFGAAMLGHGNDAVADALARQATRHASPGFLDTDIGLLAAQRLAGWLPASHRPAGIYTGGTEAVEVAMRIAAAHTGRRVFAGFNGAHHGRSFMTRALGETDPEWAVNGIHSLPFPPNNDRGRVVDAVDECLARHRPAALFIEPIHMSAGGYSLDEDVLASVVSLARGRECLVVFDELLSGGFRSGPRFYFEGAGIEPDMVVAGKALAGGFPAALLSVDSGIEVRSPRVGWRSTFTNHPLACAALAAALDEFVRLDAAGRVEEIGRIIAGPLPAARRHGRGAMWCIEWPGEDAATAAFRRLLDLRIVTSFSGRHMRLLPSLVIDPAVLDQAMAALCRVIDETS